MEEKEASAFGQGMALISKRQSVREIEASLNLQYLCEMEVPFVHDLLRARPPWMLFLVCIGVVRLLRALSSLLRWLYVTFLRPGKDLKSYGSWAVVTGATDGIGRALAIQLAREGLHLVLLGRNPSKLGRVRDEIKSASSSGSTEVECVVVDMAEDLSEGVRRLEDAIRGLDVGILVNNAGTTYPHAMYHHEVEEEVWAGVVRVNVEGTTRVSRAVLPGMVKRRRGAIVNIGSGSSMAVPSFPFYDVYAATKAYVDQLSRSLMVEYRSLGIDVQCQAPLYVATKMVGKERSTFVPEPEAYARVGVRWIGREARCSPYWPHAVQWFLASLLPDALLNAWRRRVGLAKRAEAAARCRTEIGQGPTKRN